MKRIYYKTFGCSILILLIMTGVSEAKEATLNKNSKHLNVSKIISKSEKSLPAPRITINKKKSSKKKDKEVQSLVSSSFSPSKTKINLHNPGLTTSTTQSKRITERQGVCRRGKHLIRKITETRCTALRGNYFDSPMTALIEDKNKLGSKIRVPNSGNTGRSAASALTSKDSDLAGKLWRGRGTFSSQTNSRQNIPSPLERIRHAQQAVAMQRDAGLGLGLGGDTIDFSKIPGGRGEAGRQGYGRIVVVGSADGSIYVSEDGGTAYEIPGRGESYSDYSRRTGTVSRDEYNWRTGVRDRVDQLNLVYGIDPNEDFIYQEKRPSSADDGYFRVSASGASRGEETIESGDPATLFSSINTAEGSSDGSSSNSDSDDSDEDDESGSENGDNDGSGNESGSNNDSEDNGDGDTGNNEESVMDSSEEGEIEEESDEDTGAAGQPCGGDRGGNGNGAGPSLNVTGILAYDFTTGRKKEDRFSGGGGHGVGPTVNPLGPEWVIDVQPDLGTTEGQDVELGIGPEFSATRVDRFDILSQPGYGQDDDNASFLDSHHRIIYHPTAASMPDDPRVEGSEGR